MNSIFFLNRTKLFGTLRGELCACVCVCAYIFVVVVVVVVVAGYINLL